jgi:outer membrane immunogenic protein
VSTRQSARPLLSFEAKERIDAQNADPWAARLRDFVADFETVRQRARVVRGGAAGQVGYAWNNVLFYVKGGAAVVRDKYRTFDIPTGVAFDSASETRWGGTVGAGLEFGIAPGWSLGVEYDHMFMGSKDVNFHAFGTFGTPAGTFTPTDHIKQDVDIGLVRLNYRWGGPVVARY